MSGRARWRPVPLLALLLALSSVPGRHAPLGGPAEAAAQQLRLEGESDEPAARLLRAILERGEYDLFARDTVLPPDYRARDLIVLDGDVRLEGVVEGSAALLGGALFVRPGAVIRGPVAVLDGDLVASGLAELGPVLRLPPTYRTAALRLEDEVRVHLIPPADRPWLSAAGVFGLGMPSYNRVDGLTVPAGVRLSLDPLRRGARISARALYHTARGDLGGALRLDVPVGGSVWLEAGALSRSFTPDAWVRDDLENSAATLLAGSDARNYYRSERLTLQLRRRPEHPLAPGDWHLLPYLGGMLSRDESLAARDVWTLFGDLRPNPPIAPGEVVSLLGGTEAAWRGAASSFAGVAQLEWAPSGPGDFQFAQWTVGGLWEMTALWGHRVRVAGRGMGTLGDAAPPQRWSMLGDSPTLPTLERGELRGDRLAFVESLYALPLARLQLPVAGVPELQLRHAAGTAWVTGTGAPDWTQNLGAGLAYAVFNVTAWVDPAADAFEPELTLGGTIPF